MTTAGRRSEPVTVEAFDTFVEVQADTALFELVEGVIVMMTNPALPRIGSAALAMAVFPAAITSSRGSMPKTPIAIAT